MPYALHPVPCALRPARCVLRPAPCALCPAHCGLRPAPRGQVKIEVNFEIDTDGIVNVSARDIETGQQASTTITLAGGMTEQEIAEAAARNAAVNRAEARPG